VATFRIFQNPRSNAAASTYIRRDERSERNGTPKETSNRQTANRLGRDSEAYARTTILHICHFNCADLSESRGGRRWAGGRGGGRARGKKTRTFRINIVSRSRAKRKEREGARHRECDQEDYTQDSGKKRALLSFVGRGRRRRFHGLRREGRTPLLSRSLSLSLSLSCVVSPTIVVGSPPPPPLPHYSPPAIPLARRRALSRKRRRV